MLKDKLLKDFQEKNINKSPEEYISALRTLAKKYIAANNDLVNQVWDKDLSLTNSTDIKQREILRNSINQLTQQIAKENYLEIIDFLLKEIRKLEISLYGSSDVGNSSPYKL